ncbi:MAG: glycosyltransferase family 2 protein [Candidatus Heimdallarchaeota archaeon]|nr:glycosyltransferase family 2 protein [Candidatus Heimdallarchaeota archaeon]MDH5644882.1 glycosyltransferase family 2 protein [Candidatus Heimdallarchaeota archaeon]
MKKSPRIVISFPARNEEETLGTVIDSLINQTIKPVKIIIANDGSTDKTKDIAEVYSEVEINNREKRKDRIVGRIGMSEVWNDSIIPAEKYNHLESLDYILFLGADLQLSNTYLEQLVDKFEEDPLLMAACGIMVGEHAYKFSGFMLPGGGRMMRYQYWLQIGGKYPLLQGWEAYPIYMAQMQGFKTKAFSDVEYYPLRPTGASTDYWAYGEAMKAYGYFIPFAIARCFKQIFLKHKRFPAFWKMLLGYIFGRPEKYNKDLRSFIKNYQRSRIKRLFLRK